ncbi:hypothetical protein G9A89_008726 [Geosiphon pyriformis]|nr:hypothetical protein G9A89_008726 [Geosiphon pyriformis]
MTKDLIFFIEADRPTALATIKELTSDGSVQSSNRFHLTAAITSSASEESRKQLSSLKCNVVTFDDPASVKYVNEEGKPIQKLFITLSPERLDAGLAYLEAAKKQNVPYVVLQSVVLAEKRQDRVGKIFSETERRLKELFGKKECDPLLAYEKSPEELKKYHHHFHWSVLRVGFYDHFMLAFQECIRQGILDLPIGEGKFAPVAVEDVAKAAAHLLDKSENYFEHVYTVTGQEILSGEELAYRLSKTLHRQITFKPTDDKNHILEDHLKKYFHSQIEINNLMELFELVKNGNLEYITPNFIEIDGFEPRTPEQFFLQHKEIFTDSDAREKS